MVALVTAGPAPAPPVADLTIEELDFDVDKYLTVAVKCLSGKTLSHAAAAVHQYLSIMIRKFQQTPVLKSRLQPQSPSKSLMVLAKCLRTYVVSSG